LVDEAFIAERRAGFALAKSVIASLLKLLLPLPLALFFHAFGPFASWGLSLAAAVLISLLLFLPQARRGYRPFFAIDRAAVKEVAPFSLANYVADFFWMTPGSVLPIMAVNLSSADNVAYLAVAWTIGTLLCMVAKVTSLSLFAEGSHDEGRLAHHAWRSLGFTFLILVPSVVLTLLVADKLLLLFGTAYAQNAGGLLRILALSALLYGLNVTYLTIKRVEKMLATIIGLTAFGAAVTLGFLPRMGINGVGIGWLAGQGSATLIIVVASARQGIDKIKGFLGQRAIGVAVPGGIGGPDGPALWLTGASEDTGEERP